MLKTKGDYKYIHNPWKWHQWPYSAWRFHWDPTPHASPPLRPQTHPWSAQTSPSPIMTPHPEFTKFTSSTCRTDNINLFRRPRKNGDDFPRASASDPSGRVFESLRRRVGRSFRVLALGTNGKSAFRKHVPPYWVQTWPRAVRKFELQSLVVMVGSEDHDQVKSTALFRRLVTDIVWSFFKENKILYLFKLSIHSGEYLINYKII